MKQLLLLCTILLVSCQNAPYQTENPGEVQDASTMDRFQRFVEQFPTVELPYTLTAIGNLPRVEDEFLEHILGAKNTAEFGLSLSANCIATFKVGNHIAVIYTVSERPITTGDELFELAIYTPYGAKKGGIVLGKNQKENKDYNEVLNFKIDNNFLITTEHSVRFWGKDLMETFYTQQFKITEEGGVEQTKKATYWEKIPKQIAASFVEDFKRNPSGTDAQISTENNKIILEQNTGGYAKVVFGKIPSKGADSLIFVSSLQLEPYSQTQTEISPFFVYSKLTILKSINDQFKIVTNDLIEAETWKEIYATIKEKCNCEPSPNVNENGMVSLTLLEEPMENGVYADLDDDNQIVLKCKEKGKAETVIFNLII